MTVLFAQFSGYQQFLQDSTPIPGLTLTIPQGANELALVILNVPGSHQVGEAPGGQFNLSVDGVMLPEYAAYDLGRSQGFFPPRVPATLVVAVPMKLKNQTVVAFAQRCIIDKTASLSIII
jgi:mannose-binding lectin